MKYKPGESGNAAGRPKGSLGKRNQLSANLVDEALQQLRAAVEAGDMYAVKLVIERAYPALKPVTPEHSIDAELLELKIRSMREVEERVAKLEASLLQEVKI
ncbi:hypothetical protein [Aeromonas hydrophila]|uniref:hypothetical protein n=1 Tax=Aeromonas hydrophila TaxID=644 RepID=UPI001A92821B|nr:hypothetical protein [Aeromonas hydrophila]MBO0408872.1 hypothetical protein [Aeromonas hydrophila]